MSAYGPNPGDYTFEQLNNFAKEQAEIQKAWDAHKQSDKCLGKGCPKCEEFEQMKKSAGPLA